MHTCIVGLHWNPADGANLTHTHRACFWHDTRKWIHDKLQYSRSLLIFSSKSQAEYRSIKIMDNFTDWKLWISQQKIHKKTMQKTYKSSTRPVCIFTLIALTEDKTEFCKMSSVQAVQFWLNYNSAYTILSEIFRKLVLVYKISSHWFSLN